MKTGDRVLDYVVELELGEGGMGKVYLARHMVLDQQVAIKVLDPEVARKPGVRERFIQEANIQAKLRHPGIVQVLTATQVDSGTPVLVMDYVSGKSLAEVLETRGSLPVDDALKIMMQVLSAVDYAHKQGVIHRDLKPSNIMVMANGETKVTDFGIAKVLGSAGLTRTGTAMGSAHYMSPEQIRRPEAVDARSDIYSLGCVFYEALTRRPPFVDKDASGAESDFEIKTAHVNETAPKPSSLNKNISAWLDELIMQSLEKDPGHRQASCEQILVQISTKNVGAINQPSSPQPRGRGSNDQKLSRNINFPVILKGTFAVAILMGALVLLSNFLVGDKATKSAESRETESAADTRKMDTPQSSSVPESISAFDIEYEKSLERKSVETMIKLCETWSESDEKSYAFLEYALADRVSFYGENKSKKEILKAKLDFMGKWNFRDYSVRQDSLKTQCDIKTNRCVITGLMDWAAESSASNLHSEGVASFEYGVDFSEDAPKIYMESSKVVNRKISKL